MSVDTRPSHKELNMDGNRFDEMTKALSAGGSRRSVLKVLGGAVAGGAALFVGGHVLAAPNKVTI